MQLGNPSLILSTSSEDAKKSVENEFKERHWEDFALKSAKLTLVPYYYFQYSVFGEEQKEGNNAVVGVEKGYFVLNPETNRILEQITEPIIENQLTREIKEEEIEVKKTRLEKDKAIKVCSLKAAEKHGQSLDKIIVEHIMLFYIPLWQVAVELNKEEILLRVSASTGDVLQKDKIPAREKSTGELAKEAFDELKDPKEWVRYSKELLELAMKKRSGKKGSGIWEKNKTEIIIALLLILLLAIFYLR